MKILQHHITLKIKLLITLKIKIIKRYTGLMAAGTQLTGVCRQEFALLLTYHATNNFNSAHNNNLLLNAHRKNHMDI